MLKYSLVEHDIRTMVVHNFITNEKAVFTWPFLDKSLGHQV